MRFCEVIVDVAASGVDRVFTYRLPEGETQWEVGTRVRVPFGNRRMEGFIVSLKDEAGYDEEKLKAVECALEDYPAVLPKLVELAHWIRQTYHCWLVDALRLMLPAQMRGGRVKAKMQAYVHCPLEGQRLEQALLTLSKAPKQRALLAYLAQQGSVVVAGLRDDFTGVDALVKSLEKKGYIYRSQQQVQRTPYAMLEGGEAREPKLMSAQHAAVEKIVDALGTDVPPFLISGVTGSGKTEVYIRAIRETLKRGLGAIVLVPEIALTPQMVSWFRDRFGGEAAVLHSGLSAGERFDEWQRIRFGSARVVIGARSAIFAPMERVGIIVVDEEHEATYLSDRRPRYDAREVAQQRAASEGAVLVLGSATPSLFSFAKALTGRFTLLEMPRRVMDRPMPEVEIIDMRQELVAGNNSVFSGALASALEDVLSKGEQAMLFLNRRGYATFVSCRACGYVVKCPNCDVSMTYHSNGEMRCHYCDDRRPAPKACPSCGSPHIRFFGSGTQKVEEELKKRFPGIGVVRMDNDTTREKNAFVRILETFRKGEAQVLIGTQMIAKGLDFPRVTLVGVVAADTVLHVPDFRSQERTFQLITQVAGRAGRGEIPGRVIVQTYDPDHYAIRLASNHDYRAFYELEMKSRRRSLYPPYTIVCRILVSGADGQQVEETAKELELRMKAFFESHPELQKQVVQMRALEAPIGWINGQVRWQLFLKLYAKHMGPEIIEELDALSRQGAGDVTLEVQVNPSSML